MPKLDNARIWVAKAHVAYEIQLFLRVLVEMAVRPLGTVRQRRQRAVVPCQPKVDERPAAVVFAAGPADAIFLCKEDEGLPILHLLCYAVHAKTVLFSVSMGMW